jgi:Flp pilus assembly protein TadD
MDKKNGPKLEDLLEMGKFYFFNGKLPQARQEFERAAELDPKSAEVFYNLGLVCESQNDLETAQTAYEKALSLDANHVLSRKHLNKLIGLEGM